MTAPGSVARCTPADLRLQWSSAYANRRSAPGAMARLRGRVAATLHVLDTELDAAPGPAVRAALTAEIAEVRDIATGLSRMDDRDAAAAQRPGVSEAERGKDR